MKIKSIHIGALLCLLGTFFLSGCKSNTAFTRSMYGLTTKYNILFNGREAYKQGLEKMEQADDEDYSRLIDLHPVYRLVGQKETIQNSDFDRAIEKSKKSIQTRSITNKPKRKQNSSKEYREWLNRGEWNPYIHNAWLLSGKAQFYKGDFDGAQATFGYTARHFSWKPQVIAECHIWAARCHAVQGYTYEAEAELNLVISQKKYSDQVSLSRLPEYQKLTPQLQREFSLAQAEILLKKKADANIIIGYLSSARKAWQTNEQRNRAQFLMAQLYEQAGEYGRAEAEFASVARSARSYKTQFNARIAQTRVLQNEDLAKTEKKLNAYRHQKRNAEYLDQIYYALGNVAILQHDTAKAIAQYEQALDNSTRNGMDKAVAALRLGEVTFAKEDYLKAQKAYSVAMSIIKPDYPGYRDIAHLSSVLDVLQTHAETIQLQDSLLYLASMPEAELNKVIDRIIKDLKQAEKEAEDAKQSAEYNEQASLNVNPLAQETSQPIVGQKDDSWYFYNTAVVNAGKTEFQRIWGARRPEDNWRRRNKTEVLMANADQQDGPTEDVVEYIKNPADSTSFAEEKAEVSDPHKREYYLAQIPFSDSQKANANSLIEEGMYQTGSIINEKLENFPLSIHTFEQLEKRYPDTDHRLDIYYYIYLMYMRMGDKAKAEVYRKRLMQTFPQSAYAIAVSDPNYIETLRHMEVEQDSLYITSYEAYLSGESQKVHDNYKWVHEHWPLSKLMPKFLFLHALSYVQEGNSEQFRDALEQLTATYPSSDVSPLASLMVKGIHEGRNVQTGETAKGMEWKASLRRLGDEMTDVEEISFVDNDDIPHLLLLAYKTDSISQNDLLFEIAKFNFENYLIKDFDLEIIDTGELSVLVISKFDDLDDLLEYHDRMDASNTLALPDGIYMIDISEPNFRALLGGKTFDEYFNWVKETYDL